MYKNKADFESELDICKGLRRNHRLLSNLVHSVPLSIERIDNERGRGIGSDTDVTYCRMSLMLARRFLAASTAGIADHFADRLASKLSKRVDPIRPSSTRVLRDEGGVDRHLCASQKSCTTAALPSVKIALIDHDPIGAQILLPHVHAE